MGGTVLILGATGRFGRNAADAFWNAGWRVRPFDRAADDLMVAARDVDVIVHGWNPPYPEWEAQVPGQVEQVIAAARVSDATVILPGNIYVYGQGAPAVLGPKVPHAATNPLGRVRIAMEERLRGAGVQVIVLRAGDFLDTEASGNWFDSQMAPSLRRGVLTYPGSPEVAHAWAFLPDMARAAVALAEQRRTLPVFSDVAFPGYTLTGDEMAAALSAALGRPIRVKRMSWMPIRMLAPFWRLAPSLLEMRYLWDKPHCLCPESFDALLPEFVPTDPQEALAKVVGPVLGHPSNAAPDRPTPTHGGPRLMRAQ